jgi:DNA-binding CsgD family transcriptional regulator
MPHAVVFIYVGATMAGLTALAVSVLGTLRSRVSSYRLLVVFYGAFTAEIATLFVREYMMVDIASFSYDAVLGTYVVAIILSQACLAAVALFYHRIFALPAQRILDGIVLGVAVFGAAVFSWPGSVTMDAEHARFVRHLPVIVGSGAYLVLFAYVLVVGAVGSKADRPPRELLLIWATFGFGVVGFAESAMSLVQAVRDPVVTMKPFSQGFLVSTIPYLLFGGVLAYFFGSFLVSNGREPRALDADIVRRYGITVREQEVIALLNEGLGNREIAGKLFVSLATVKSHVHNIYEKTGAEGRYALFRLTAPAEKRSA